MSIKPTHSFQNGYIQITSRNLRITICNPLRIADKQATLENKKKGPTVSQLTGLFAKNKISLLYLYDAYPPT